MYSDHYVGIEVGKESVEAIPPLEGLELVVEQFVGFSRSLSTFSCDIAYSESPAAPMVPSQPRVRDREMLYPWTSEPFSFQRRPHL